jgi:hypothetical protein
MRSSKKACKYVLSRLSKESLLRLCEKLDLPSYGSKIMLIDRILKAHDGDHRDLIELLRGADLKEILNSLDDEGMVGGPVSGTVGQMASRLKRIVTRSFFTDEGGRASDTDFHGQGISALSALFSKEAIASAAEHLELSGKGTAEAIVERITWFYTPYFFTILKSFSLNDLKAAARKLDMSPSAGRDELASAICRQLGLDANEIDRRKRRARPIGDSNSNNVGVDTAMPRAIIGEIEERESDESEQLDGNDEDICAQSIPDPDFACFGAYSESANACMICDKKEACADAAKKAEGIFGDTERLLNTEKDIDPEELIKAKKVFNYGTDEQIRSDDLSRRYRELQLKWHPDQVCDKPDEFVNTYMEMSKLINKMYEALKRVAL